MTTAARQREYGENSIEAGGALGYFQRMMALTTGPVELRLAIENGKRPSASARPSIEQPT